MKAIVCNEFAPLDQLAYMDVPDPEAGANEVVVSVKAAGVNYPDALVVQGLYQAKPPRPFIPGFEFAGDVTAVGAGVQGLPVGARVMGLSPAYGAYAEKIAVPALAVIPIPDDMSYADAANLACAHGTAHHALKQRAQLQSGETLLVLGAAGGTGIAAVQIGKAMGATVIAACSSAEKLAVAKENGADVLINYRDQDLRQALKEATAGKGVDVVYDPVGGEAFDACTRSMARNGRLLVIGFASGKIPTLPVNMTLVKEYSVTGVFWGNFTQHEPAVYADNLKELFQWYLQGQVTVVTDASMPLAEAPTALARLMDRDVKGKLVLIP
ncbi:NADPH:quinone oxidoreductase family protein [Pseudomaricurvus sp. HS19]|uniref:NADPH:quinone oxidoreductase family protein n=1 Tax=Pseudomaricurvus sp. HS19 TaxID=2692626 RepID=UPI00136F0415|nr:NADPH:quinone oxidoreductase family protein [Pseudomaricurvus sp. HS19]MYM64421.1 zinc-binding dehydrogenase [Pseudomaricurvus sp. HS19]